jgi:hypothetical protein
VARANIDWFEAWSTDAHLAIRLTISQKHSGGVHTTIAKLKSRLGYRKKPPITSLPCAGLVGRNGPLRLKKWSRRRPCSICSSSPLPLPPL